MSLKHERGLERNRSLRMVRLRCIGYWFGWFYPGSAFDRGTFPGGLPTGLTPAELHGIMSEFERGKKDRGKKFRASELGV